MHLYAQSKQTTAKPKRDFKKKADANDSRRTREDNVVRIRKNKKIENLQKRRKETKENDGEPEVFVPQQNGEWMEELKRLYDGLSADKNTQYESMVKLRKLLSIEHNPPIQDIIDAGFIPQFVQLLTRVDFPQIQFEACWALTNVASGSSHQTLVVIESGSIPLFQKLLYSPNEEVREQAIWALGNIAGDSTECRDYVLSFNTMEGIILNFSNDPKPSLVRNATWTLSNLCRGKPQPDWNIVSKCLPIVAQLLYSADEEILTDACWALSYLSDGPNENIQAVINVGVVRRIVELLLHPSVNVQTPALRTVGNIVTGDDTQTQIILNSNVLPSLSALLSSAKKGLRKEACWTISNITAGSVQQIDAVIDAKIMPRLISLLRTSDYDIKKEAIWALSNATSGGSPEQIKFLVECNILEPFCDLLSQHDSKVVLVALEAIENILRSGAEDGDEDYTTLVEQCGGLDKIEALQNHSNVAIYDKVVDLLETFFGAEEEDDQNIAPNVNSSSTAFNFGVQAAMNFNF